MSQFEILIRSSSYFSRVAELMGNHKLIIYPISSHWQQNKLIIDTIGIRISGDIDVNLADKIKKATGFEITHKILSKFLKSLNKNDFVMSDNLINQFGPNLVNYTNKKNYSPLTNLLCSENINIKAIKYLMEKNANINIINNDISIKNNAQIIKLLNKACITNIENTDYN